MCHTAVLDCGTDLHAPQGGRRFVAAVLDECFGPGHPDPATRGDIALVATELLTNAARAAESVVRLGLEVHSTWVEVSVTDDSPAVPRPRAATALDTTGRGLAIVEALASDWGVRPAGGSSGSAGLKAVWVRVALTGSGSGSGIGAGAGAGAGAGTGPWPLLCTR